MLNNANNQREKTGFIVCFDDILAVSRPDSSCLTVARFTCPDSPRAEKRAKKRYPKAHGASSLFCRFSLVSGFYHQSLFLRSIAFGDVEIVGFRTHSVKRFEIQDVAEPSFMFK